MKTLSSLFLLINLITCSAPPKTVYICNSDGAKKYHLISSCKGLSNCSHQVIQVSIDKAKEQGKTLCGWEK